MKKQWFLGAGIALMVGAALGSCASGGTGAGQEGFDAEISARGAIGRMEAVVSGPLYEDAGGADMRLAVLAPETQGGGPEDAWLPVYIQGLLNNNFRKYSAITVIDRQNLDKILAEQDLAAGGRFSDKDFVSIGNLTNAQYVLAGTLQKLPGGAFSLQLAVTNLEKGERRASFMKNGSLAALQNGALINEASADLLSQLGVTLTVYGQQSLTAGSSAVVKAETGLARGITAQASGAEVDALLNYSQAVLFDPSQMEAIAKLESLSGAISGGTISRRITNDIAARKAWLEAFKSAAAFYNEHPPYEITFDTSLIQEGETDYARETADLAMWIRLSPSEASWTALNALIAGLEKTGNRQKWGFANLPLMDPAPPAKDAVVFGGKKTFTFTVEAALVNETGKTIARNKTELRSANIDFSPGAKEVRAPAGMTGQVKFPKVNANDLTDTLTIVIVSVNNIPARQLNTTGYMRITAEEGMVEREIKKTLVFIKGGTFTMGSPASEAGRAHDEVQHQVTVDSFYLSKYEVTQKEYQTVMGVNPSEFKGDNLPVENVSWYDAVNYCNALSRKEGLTPAYTVNGTTVTWNRNTNGYRLPTEAEWEYACRAGTTGPYAGSGNVDKMAWYQGNSQGTTHPVGQKQPNAWGLYDMHGNVGEWCWDWYGDYPRGAQTNPSGAASGSSRVRRGGSWYSVAENLRSAVRVGSAPYYSNDNLGFRLVRNGDRG